MLCHNAGPIKVIFKLPKKKNDIILLHILKHLKKQADCSYISYCLVLNEIKSFALWHIGCFHIGTHYETANSS